LNQDLPGLINDDVEDEVSNDEEDRSVHSDAEGGKRRHRDSDIDEDLEDEDYDLIEENLGVKVDRVCCCCYFADASLFYNAEKSCIKNGIFLNAR